MHKKTIFYTLLVAAFGASAQVGGLPAQVGSGVARVGTGVAASPQSGDATSPPPKTQAAPQITPRSNGAPLPLDFPGKSERGVDSSAVRDVMEMVSPLNPDEIKDLRRQMLDRQQAYQANITGKPPAKPTTSIYNLDLSPGATPPVVRVEVGQGSIISFLDAAGNPWPAKVADNFAPGSITLSQFTAHQLSIGTTSPTAVNAGVAVALQDVPIAITFNVISGQPLIDAQVHMVVPRYINGTPPGVGSLRGEPTLTSADLMSFLLKTPPSSAKQLNVQGLPGTLAWQISPSRMVIRTNALVTTGAFRVQGIGDGTFVYEIPLTPLVMVSSGSVLKRLQIDGFSSIDQKKTN